MYGYNRLCNAIDLNEVHTPEEMTLTHICVNGMMPKQKILIQTSWDKFAITVTAYGQCIIMVVFRMSRDRKCKHTIDMSYGKMHSA